MHLARGAHLLNGVGRGWVRDQMMQLQHQFQEWRPHRLPFLHGVVGTKSPPRTPSPAVPPHVSVPRTCGGHPRCPSSVSAGSSSASIQGTPPGFSPCRAELPLSQSPSPPGAAATPPYVKSAPPPPRAPQKSSPHLQNPTDSGAESAYLLCPVALAPRPQPRPVPPVPPPRPSTSPPHGRLCAVYGGDNQGRLPIRRPLILWATHWGYVFCQCPLATG